MVSSRPWRSQIISIWMPSGPRIGGLSWPGSVTAITRCRMGGRSLTASPPRLPAPSPPRLLGVAFDRLAALERRRQVRRPLLGGLDVRLLGVRRQRQDHLGERDLGRDEALGRRRGLVAA